MQRVVIQQFMAVSAAADVSREAVAAKALAVELLCKLTDSWRTLVAEKRDLRGIPRAGTKTPAERAAAARKTRTPRAAPFVQQPAKESINAGEPSPRGGAVGGATTGDQGQGVPPLPEQEKSSVAVPFVAKGAA